MGTIRYGFDTVSVTQSTASAATTKFGRADFWCRYLKPSSWPMTTSTAVSECRLIWDYTKSASAVVFIQGSTQSRLSGTLAMGTADATTFCQSFHDIYTAVGPLVMPASGRVYVYLDVETGTHLSAAYWTGWANYVNSYSIAGLSAPLYAGMYCNPNEPSNNCNSVLPSPAMPNVPTCFSVWSSQPEPCSGCGKPFGTLSWQPVNCSAVTTHMWQLMEQPCTTKCGGSALPNVDLNMTNPSYDLVAQMMYLNGRP